MYMYAHAVQGNSTKHSLMMFCWLHVQIGLWGYFAHNVISFRRGLMNPTTAEEFKGYLKEEVVKGSSGSYKKVIGTKVRKWGRQREVKNTWHTMYMYMCIFLFYRLCMWPSCSMTCLSGQKWSGTRILLTLLMQPDPAHTTPLRMTSWCTRKLTQSSTVTLTQQCTQECRYT